LNLICAISDFIMPRDFRSDFPSRVCNSNVSGSMSIGRINALFTTRQRNRPGITKGLRPSTIPTLGQYPLNNHRVFDTGEHFHGVTACTAGLNVDIENAFHALYPRSSMLGGGLRLAFVGGFERVALTCGCRKLESLGRVPTECHITSPSSSDIIYHTIDFSSFLTDANIDATCHRTHYGSNWVVCVGKSISTTYN
jgi:hypothetical protein